MHELWTILGEILILLSAAFVLGVVFEHLKQSAILGYLVAGTLVGPNVLNLVHEGSHVEHLAELGVALLLFAIGLEFSLKRLVRVGVIGLGGGSLQVAITLGLAAGVAMLLGVSTRPAVAIGAMVALSSTACVLRVLTDRAEIDSVYGRSSLGILLLQDIAVVPLVLMVAMLGGAGEPIDMAIGLGKAALLIVAMLVAFYVFSNYVLARLLYAPALMKNRELLIILAVILALGSAAAAQWLGLGPALGAFLAGVMLAESPFAMQVRSDVGALRTLFVTLFFTSIGMLGNPSWIMANWPAVLGIVALIVFGKAAIIAAIAVILKRPLRHAVATGICLAQVGEFSFVIAGVARTDALINDYQFRLIVSATLVTLLLTPYLVMFAPLIGQAIRRLGGKHVPHAPEHEDADRAPMKDHVIIVGFGPAGQRIADTLVRRSVPVLVIDLRPRNVTMARTQGVAAILGDAGGSEMLHHAHVDQARALVVTIPDHRSVLQIVHEARAVAPHVPILARARYHAFVQDIENAGAQVVVDEERQIGRRMSLELRRWLTDSGSELLSGLRTGDEQTMWRHSEGVKPED